LFSPAKQLASKRNKADDILLFGLVILNIFKGKKYLRINFG